MKTHMSHITIRRALTALYLSNLGQASAAVRVFGAGGFGLGLSRWGVIAFENIRTKKLQIHQASIRDSVFSPVGDRWRFYIAQARNFVRSAECIYDFVRVHKRHNKAYLITSQGIPYCLAVRLA